MVSAMKLAAVFILVWLDYCDSIVMINSGSPSDCPFTWVSYPNSDFCYKFWKRTLPIPRDKAVHVCRLVGSELVTFDSQEELTWLISQGKLYQTFRPYPEWWIDVRYTEKGLVDTNGDPYHIQFPTTAFYQPSLTVPCGYISNDDVRFDNCTQHTGVICKQRKDTVLLCDYDDGWVAVNGSCLRHSVVKKTWNDAITTCEKLQSALATVDNSIRTSFVFHESMFRISWVGFQQSSSGAFTWSNGTPVNTSLLQPQSTPKSGKSERWSLDNCSYLNVSSASEYRLGTGGCMETREFTCEKMQGQCPDGWLIYRSTCFKFFPRIEMTCMEARNYCLSLDADLLKILSAGIQMKVNELLSEFEAMSVNYFWIGISDFPGMEFFKWVDGTPVSNYDNWSLNPPVNVAGLQECAYIDTADPLGKWRVDSALRYKPFGCSRAASKPIGHANLRPGEADCEDGWRVVGDSCIYISGVITDWVDATTKCASLNSQVAVIKTQDAYRNLADPYSEKCGQSWVERSGTDFCYQFRDLSTTWDEAVMICSNQNGSLASITSQEEQRFIEVGDAAVTIEVQTTPPGVSGSGYMGCPAGWDLYNSQCYMTQVQHVTWSEAQAWCKDQNSHLAKLESFRENFFLWGSLPQTSPESGFWIGLKKNHSDKIFRWTDNSAASLTNWNYDSQITQISLTSVGPCVAVNTRDGKWDEVDCNTKMAGYVCMRPAETLSYPSLPFYRVGCSYDSFGYGPSCFTVYDAEKTWDDAQSSCQSVKGHLAVIPDGQTNAFIKSQLPEERSSYWIGLSTTSDSIAWVNDQIITYLPISLVSSYVSLNACYVMDSSAWLNSWYDRECDGNESFICQSSRQGYIRPSVTTSTSSTQTCPQNWKLFGDRCYYISLDKQSMRDAERACQSFGTSLASIHTDHQTILLTYEFSRLSDSRSFWIGLYMDNGSTACSGPSWTYYNGFCYYVSADLRDWHGARSTCLSLGADLVSVHSLDEEHALSTLKSDVWLDESCTALTRFVCKRRGQEVNDPSSSPTPATSSPGSGTTDTDPGEDGICPHKFFSLAVSRKCYYLSDKRLDWSSARQACKNMSTAVNVTLASINSQVDQDMVIMLAREYKQDFWIGFNNTDRSEFQWVDGSQVTFVNWGRREPRVPSHYSYYVSLFHSTRTSTPSCFILHSTSDESIAPLYVCKRPV
ncbi:C-type mannose receptor 2-like [Physella acuta]|uniref:C-type mannose receptor 2-like n=1 Tax=Physella acuta TaxID=109671 RepID=UPI0027DDE19C|nr:C-type mannose receptor 2-like [Physella acuta]